MLVKLFQLSGHLRLILQEMAEFNLKFLNLLLKSRVVRNYLLLRLTREIRSTLT
jgi:hypothetical protein